MNNFYEYFIKHYSYLTLEYEFEINVNEQSESFGGNALIVLKRSHLYLRFVKDRGEIYLDFSNDQLIKNKKWYSVGLVRNQILNEESFNDQMTVENQIFLRERLDDIFELFSKDNELSTFKGLEKQAEMRVKKFLK
jgi:hypothetical protein